MPIDSHVRRRSCRSAHRTDNRAMDSAACPSPAQHPRAVQANAGKSCRERRAIHPRARVGATALTPLNRRPLRSERLQQSPNFCSGTVARKGACAVPRVHPVDPLLHSRSLSRCFRELDPPAPAAGFDQPNVGRSVSYSAGRCSQSSTFPKFGRLRHRLREYRSRQVRTRQGPPVRRDRAA